MADHPETNRCTPTHGPRPAGPPDACFYCHAPVGVDHAADCVCRVRSAVIRATIEYSILIPQAWTPGDFDFARNENGCQSNLIAELKTLEDAPVEGGCLCGRVHFEIVREATAEDEARDGIAERLREEMGQAGEVAGPAVEIHRFPGVDRRVAVNGIEYALPEGTRYVAPCSDGSLVDAQTGEPLPRVRGEVPDGEE